jgi:hypothetical protein
MKPTMHDRTPVGGPPRRAWSAAIRTAAAILTTAAMALLAAACSSPSSAGAGSPTTADSAGSSLAAGNSAASHSAVAYSQCMRSNGVPRYPDPASGGQLPKGDAQAFGVSDAQYQAAQRTCQHLLPTGGSFIEQAQECIQAGDCPPALVQQMLTADRKFAHCMRSHGVPNWPDPTIGANGGPVFKVSAAGITHTQTHSPPMSNTIGECMRLDPAPVAMA